MQKAGKPNFSFSTVRFVFSVHLLFRSRLFVHMKFNAWLLAGMTSAIVIAGPANAQTKKPTPKKPATVKSASSAATAAAGADLKTSQDSISYSIGLFMAQNLKQQGMNDLNQALLTKGIQDAMGGGKTRLTQEQAGTVLNAYAQKQYAVRNAEAQKASAGNKKIGEAFMAENKTKPGVVTTASGLQYIVEKEGTGAKPTASDRVKVHYTGKLLDGKVFDSSVERGTPAEFGVSEVIKGWTEALQLMPVGSKWKLFIPAEIAYGDRGAGADIKPGSTLVFDVELLDIVKQ